MLTILGPAKTIDTSPHGVTERHGYPQYLDQAEELVDLLRFIIQNRINNPEYLNNDLSNEKEWVFCR